MARGGSRRIRNSRLLRRRSARDRVEARTERLVGRKLRAVQRGGSRLIRGSSRAIGGFSRGVRKGVSLVTGRGARRSSTYWSRIIRTKVWPARRRSGKTQSRGLKSVGKLNRNNQRRYQLVSRSGTKRAFGRRGGGIRRH